MLKRTEISINVRVASLKDALHLLNKTLFSHLNLLACYYLEKKIISVIFRQPSLSRAITEGND